MPSSAITTRMAACSTVTLFSAWVIRMVPSSARTRCALVLRPGPDQLAGRLCGSRQIGRRELARGCHVGPPVLHAVEDLEVGIGGEGAQRIAQYVTGQRCAKRK